MRTHLATAAAALAAAALLTACGSGNPQSAGAAAATSPASDGAAGTTEITVGVMPIVDTAPIYLGVQEGIFAEHGLVLDLQTSSQGAAAMVPGVVSGQLDFGFGNVAALITAHSQGLALPVVASASSTTGIDGADTAGIIVAADSDITGPGELEDARVAVNTMNSIGDTTVRETVDNAGGDGSSVKFAEIAFPDMLPAIESGQIDAAWVVEPFLTIALEQGARLLASNYVATSPDLLIAAYFTSADLAESDPELVERFGAAMQESQAFAEENEDLTRAVLGTYMTIDPAIAEKLVLPRYNAEVTRPEMEFLVDFAERQGLISDPVAVSSLLPDA
ncbi:ABC transporter substrate-binding protein [Georgenia yuyongxinii]|uniref:Nitrate ABC transporter substrate-binding protein n=1 Tax=Georgenia yuyongxinii TaxID=2589797 RepID=A0A552WSK0_9MICO|nr:ABC transporter substrate-binding protein [Georgenia yuyongxinii]TRW45821.1 nitrate ABC transporter substrate-binding protein [Georgenia yuyongxinii]